MIIEKNIITAEFIKRPNRFQAYVKLGEEVIMVHVPNTGRCREILIPGCKVLLREENNPARKTKYDLIAGYKGDMLINIDSQIPNKVVEEALRLSKIEKLKKYDLIQREKTFKNSRFDFKLTESHKLSVDKVDSFPPECEYFLEVKGVTYEQDGKTMFPDAPTDRGRKHLLELVEVKKTGRGAGVLFLIQLENAEFFTPHDVMDKKFGEALRFASKNGVDVFAYDCSVTENSITLKNKVKVKL